MSFNAPLHPVPDPDPVLPPLPLHIRESGVGSSVRVRRHRGSWSLAFVAMRSFQVETNLLQSLCTLERSSSYFGLAMSQYTT